MNKILIPCDFSDTSENALNYAVELAKYLNYDLVLLHVNQIPAMNSEFGITSYEIADAIPNSQESLKELADKILQNEPLISGVTYYSEIGNATDTIIDYAKRNDIAIIVMGISGHGNKLMKAFLGSTAVNVSKKTETPLIIVPPDVKYKKNQNIAYACDYDEHIESNLSLIQVRYINMLLGANLHVLHVVPENHHLNTKESHLDSYVEHSLENAAHKTYIITDNNVSEGLLSFIENHDIDLIVIEPKKHSIFHNIFYPSVTNEVAFFSPVPVLTIHG
ncbi:MAG: universal stress protein [Bacteroidetes bacterium]|nr:universal stress protein [Bacteroidota bacterium]